MNTVTLRFTSESEAFADHFNYKRIGWNSIYRFIGLNGYKQEVWEVVATGKV